MENCIKYLGLLELFLKCSRMWNAPHIIKVKDTRRVLSDTDTDRISDGVESETGKSQACFQEIKVLSEALMQPCSRIQTMVHIFAPTM